MGCARRLRRDRPDLMVVAAKRLPGEGIDGLRWLEDADTPEILDLSLFNRQLLVATRIRCADCARWRTRRASSRRLLRWRAARRDARGPRLDGPANIVMVLADGGWKYLWAGAWDAPEAELLDRMEQGVWW